LQLAGQLRTVRRPMLPILFVTVFLDLVGFGIIVPFLAYYVESFGARAAVVGLLMGSYSLAQFIFAPIWGRVSDRVGRRPILLVGLAGSVVGFTTFGLAGTLAVLFIGRIVMGIFGATIPTAQAAVADVTSPENRAKGMGMIGAAIGLGFILGPALGGILAHLSSGLHVALFQRNPYALPCLAAAALAALNWIAAAFLLPESLPDSIRLAPPPRVSRLRSLSLGFSDPRLRRLVLILFLFMLGFTMMEATLTLFIEARIGTPNHADLVRRVGYLFGFIGVIQVALQGGLVGILARKFGEPRLLVTGCVLAMISLGSVPLVRSWGALYLVALGLAAAGGLAQPSVASLISRAASADRQGGTLGVSQSASSLARVLGPVLAGALFQQISPGAPYVLAALLALAAAACVRLTRTEA
jgi:MFS family permease